LAVPHRSLARRTGDNTPDLPGYGWAKVSQKERASWQHLIESYLEDRPSCAPPSCSRTCAATSPIRWSGFEIAESRYLNVSNRFHKTEKGYSAGLKIQSLKDVAMLGYLAICKVAPPFKETLLCTGRRPMVDEDISDREYSRSEDFFSTAAGDRPS